MSCSVTYADRQTYTASATPNVYGTEQTYRCSSLFDVDLTNAGHQPYYFDTLSLIYNRYCVKAVTAEITFTNPSADGVIWGIEWRPFDATGGITNLAAQLVHAAAERPNVVTGVLNNTGPQAQAALRRRFTIAELEGLTPAQFIGSWQTYGALVSANPTCTPYLTLAIAGQAGSETAVVLVRLMFEVDFWERNIVAQS
jgi:hypothetical protein